MGSALKQIIVHAEDQEAAKVFGTLRESKAASNGGDVIELKTRFPQPLRVVIRQNFWWFFFASLLALLIFAAWDGVALPDFLDSELLLAKKAILLMGILMVLFVRVGYGLLYRATYQYRIERGRLKIRRGAFLKEEASLPLVPLTELYLRRNWLDFLFGLTNVYIAVILERAQRIGEIRGLKTHDAREVKNIILGVIEGQGK